MKKTSTGLLFIIMLTSAICSAQSKDSVPTHFDKVAELFNSGESAKLNEIQENGWIAGRCFSTNAPDTPFAALITEYKTDNTSEGPAFPPSTKVGFLFLIPNMSEAYFDDGSSDSAALTYFALKENDSDWSVPTEKQKSLSVDVNINNELVNSFGIRKTKDYFSLELKCENSRGCVDARSGVIRRQNDVIYACYFFKVVQKKYF